MKFTMYALFTNPMARFLARFSRRCTVTLSTGKEIKFDKRRHCGSASYEGAMSKVEENEYIRAMMLMGI